MTSEGRLGGSWFIKILCFNLNEYKKPFLTNAKILSECECTMYDPVYSTPFQVYYKTAIFNPESHSESYEVLSIKKNKQTKRWTRCFFVSLPCYRRLSSDKPLRRKEGHGTFHISSVAQPPRGRVANQIIINTGIHMGFWGGTIFLMHTHKHTSDGDYELSKTLLSALNSYSLQCNSLAANR